MENSVCLTAESNQTEFYICDSRKNFPLTDNEGSVWRAPVTIPFGLWVGQALRPSIIVSSQDLI